MKTTGMWLLAALAAMALAVVGCGGDDTDSTSASDDAPTSIEEISVDTGPFESVDDFNAAADQACGDYGSLYLRAPVYGIGEEGLTAEFTRRVEINTAFQDDLESIEAPDEVAATWQDFLDAGAELNANEEKVLAAAAAGDVDEANRILNEDNTEAIDAYNKATEELGVCSTTDPPDPATAAEASDAAADAPQPNNTTEDAAGEFLAALQSGDCQQLADAQHSQNYAEPEDDCTAIADSEKDSDVLATAQYGPAGASMMGTDESSGYQYYVLDPKTGGLKVTTTVYTDTNALDPPNEGIDADATVAAALDAIRNDDVDAFNETLPLDTVKGGSSFLQTGETIESIGSDPVYADRVIADIKDDPEAEPALLGVNQAMAFYLLDTENTDYILTALHQPGSETHYAFNSFWAIEE